MTAFVRATVGAGASTARRSLVPIEYELDCNWKLAAFDRHYVAAMNA